MLIRILMLIFPKSLSVIFFGQIWSQNLKFSKLTKMLCRGTLLHVCYDFNIYFFKIFVIHKIWISLVQKSDVVLIDWNLAFVYAMLIPIERSNFAEFSCRSALFSPN